MRVCKVCGITENETKIYKDLCRKHYLQIKRHGHILTRTIYDTNEISVEGSIATMSLYNKKGSKIAETIFDSKYVDKIKEYKWYLRIHKKNNLKYVMGTIGNKKIFLHRFILNTPSNKVVDHINGNTLDNRESNIRICTQANNSKNRIYKTSKGKVPGIYQQYGENGNYSVRITVNYKNIHIGTFKTYEEAVKARLEAEEKYFGEYNVHSGQLK